MVWIVALALSALTPQVSQKHDVSCDLAPYLGRGSSSEGSLDTYTGVGLGCSLVLLESPSWTLGPRVSFAEQRWSVYQKTETETHLKSYQARTLGLGVQARYSLTQTWRISYALSYAQGQGQQEQSLSTASSAQNLRFSTMSQRNLGHELTLQKQLTPRLSMLAGLQYDDARQAWSAASGRLEQQNVAPGNKLTLTSGTAQNLASTPRDYASYQSYSLRLGLSMLLN